MHLERAMFNTHGKCKPKLNKKQQRAKEEHDKWLRSKGVHPEQIAAKRAVTVKREKVAVVPTYKPKTSDTVGNGFKKPEQVYTGTNLIGIATMHKSNMVPVFRKEDAEAISSMRR